VRAPWCLGTSALTAAAAVALVALAAWLPSLQAYVPVAEDYSRAHVAQPGLNAYWQWFLAHSQQEGLWRVIGLPFTDFARNIHPFRFPARATRFTRPGGTPSIATSGSGKAGSGRLAALGEIGNTDG